MSILVIQHDPDKGLGLFLQPLAEAALELDICFAGRDELELGDHNAVIALPGVANPDEDTLAVSSTRAVLGEALRRDVPAFGICLGAELLAEAAGAATHACPPQWGYCDVSMDHAASKDALLGDLPPEFTVFQAHNFGFALPPGAVSLAHSPGALQAFRIGSSAWGVQFHPEPTLEMIDGWTTSLGHLMQAGGVDPELTRRLARRHVPDWTEHAAAMTQRFATVVRSATPAASL